MMTLSKIAAPTPRFIICKLAFVALVLSGCASRPDVPARINAATDITTQQGWIARDIAAGDFTLRSYAPPNLQVDVLRVYIEGDGFAWANRSTPSSNPTPINPMALKLAMADGDKRAVYLARPCQFNESCTDKKWWTHNRFAPQAVLAASMAIDDLKARHGATRVELAGYSGGGVMAALVAAGRDDVVGIITIASPMDTSAWVAHHRISPLTGSRNPADIAGAIAHIPQMHFVGQNDKVVPESVVRAYAGRFSPPARVNVVAGYDHVCCWAQNWRQHTYGLDIQ